MPSRGLLLRRSLLALLCGLFATVASRAQEPAFNPSIGARLGYTDNVQFVGGETRGDTLAVLDVDLPWTRTTRHGSMQVSYRPLLLRYHEFGNLDRTEHRLDGGISRTWRRSTLGFSAQLRLTQQQGDAFSVDGEDLFLNRREDRQVYRAAATYDRSLAGRWQLASRVGGALLNYDPIEGEDPSVATEDRSELDADLRLSRSLTRTARLGLQYGYRHFELELSGNEEVNLLGVVYSRELSRATSLELGAGVFASRGETVESREDYALSLSLRHTLHAVALRLVGSRQPTSGGAGRGTSTNSLLGLVVEKRERVAWYWQASARLAYRDPTSTEDRRLSLAVGASAERRLSDRVGFRLDARWLEQVLDDPGRTDQSVFGATAGLIWYPRGTARVGRH